MIKAPTCANPNCSNPLKTRHGKTGLCRHCTSKINAVKRQSFIMWTPQEIQTIQKIKALQNEIHSLHVFEKEIARTVKDQTTLRHIEIQLLKDGLFKRHGEVGYYNKARRVAQPYMEAYAR